MTKSNLPVWDLSTFYNSHDDPQLAKDMKRVTKNYSTFQKKYKNKIKNLSSVEIEEAMSELQHYDDTAERIGSYVGLLVTTDTINKKYMVLQQQIIEWTTELAKITLFFSLEWKALPEEHAQKILKGMKNPLYKHFLSHKRSFAKYTLPAEIEEVILEKDITGVNSWDRLFSQITATLEFEYNKKKLTQSQILSLVSDKNRTVRKRSAESVTKTLESRKMELTHIFNTLLADKMIEDKRRGYESWLTGRNLANKVSDEIVTQLVTSVTKRYDLVSKHYNLKKKLLGLDTLFEYDRYAPITFTKIETKIPWTEGKALVTNAYMKFSPEAGAVIDEFFTRKYIHAALLPNKRGGAFCASTVSSVHPYILVNYMEKADDVMTLAHELGHGLHQYWAGKTQGDYGLGMPLVTQEMASTFGEMIVFHELKKRITNKKEKLTLLTQKIDSTIATVFRQISMHCFEDIVHKRRQRGELTYEDLCEAWMTTQQAMFGKSVTLTDNYQGWWSYIPHFIHTPGYVYSYAFGELLALSLYELYKKNPEEFTPRYVDLLKAGDSDYPASLLMKAGIDIQKPTFWNEGLRAIEELIDEEIELSSHL